MAEFAYDKEKRAVVASGMDPYRMLQVDLTHPNSDGEDWMAQQYFTAIFPYIGAPSYSPQYSVLNTPLYVSGSVGQELRAREDLEGRDDRQR